jgi:glutaredoxin
LILVIGKENCSACSMVKSILISRDIDFEYHYLEEYSQEKQKEIKDIAKKAGQMSLPIILKDNEVITLEEV